MTGFLTRRLILALVTIVGVSIVVFVISRLSGDVVFLLLPQDATPAEVAQLRAELGLDRPLWVQYWAFASGVVNGDFGDSIRYRQDALALVLNRLPASMELAFVAFSIAIISGIGLGVTAARSHLGWIDRCVRMFAAVGQSTPPFVLGLIVILIFAVRFGWLPTSGRSSPLSLVMPSVTLAIFSAASVLRLTRSAMIENLDADYIRFLRIKGVSERSILWKHALRNSLIPVVALAGIQLGNLFGSAVIVETVFNWPGIGSLLVEAIKNRDYPVIQAGVLITSTFLICLNLLVDLSFGLIDRRITRP